MPFREIDPNWRKKYSTLKEFYAKEYDPKYYTFSKYEVEIDPMETVEEVEKYDVVTQQRELRKCALSFAYFCNKYVKIAHPKRGLISFILYKYQRRVIKEYESHRFNILSKFRQGGLTTVTVCWALWRCLFKLDETIMVLSKSDREAIAAGEIVKRALQELPNWMRPEMEKNNDHQKIFMDTGCKLFFYTPEAARGRSITYLILDEAAFIPAMEKHWKAMFPTISTGGHCICISTVNGVGNWYYEVFMGARKKKGFGSEFHIIELDYWEHPDYDDELWVRQTRAQLGEKGWKQEVLRDFLGAGDSYIPPDICSELDVATRQPEADPMRKLFPQWNNAEEAFEEEAYEMADWETTWVRGALHIWREPIDGREYVIGVDTAEGLGEENDNSCFQVLDQVTCEQVAEFYSNSCPIHNFSQTLAMVGRTYNNALVIIESIGPGLAVLEKLQHDFFYENLYYTVQGQSKNAIPGIKTSQQSRPKFLETMQTRLINKSIAIRSKRFVKELRGFVWNRDTKRAEASKGFHDDAIMALCLALYGRDSRSRQSPVGIANDEDYSEAYKAEIYEDIKRELERNAPEDWMHPDDFDLMTSANNENDNILGIMSDYRRPHDAILREFGW